MRVLLLSAGYGKRMRPLTLTTPKCLIKVNNKTLLEMWLEKFSQLRVKNIINNQSVKYQLNSQCINLTTVKED